MLLDEPTNHLDMEMRHALTLALQDFDGAMLLVSHDRALIRDTTDELWLVADGRLQVYEDDLDTYTRWLARFRQQQAQSQADGTAEDPEQPKVDAKAQRRLAAEQRQRLAPMKKAIDKLEQSMSRLNSELEEIESALGDTSLYQTENKDRLKELLARQTSRKQELETLEAQWLDASEEMESLQASAEF